MMEHQKKVLVSKENAENVFLKWFIWSAGAIFVITGVAKMLSASGHAKVLNTFDPIFGIKYRVLLPLTGIVELAIANLCLLVKSRKLISMLVALLATNLFIYRLGLWWMDWRGPCSCFGNLTDALHISAATGGAVIQAVLGYLLVGSYGFLYLGKAAPRART